MRTLQMLLIGLALAIAFAPVATAQETRRLDDMDEWKGPETDPSPPAQQLTMAKQALARGEASRAQSLVDAWLERYPTHPLRPEALLVQGDALLAQGDEYKALFSYEDLIRRYPMSEFFVPALEREFQVAVAYANGLKRKFFGTFRIIDAGPEAQEILIRIQERLPGSALAERAGMELADYYFRIRDMALAVEAYDVFIQNYPRSRQINKARLRLIASHLAQFKGPPYDASGLVEATVKIKELQAIEPVVAQQVGAEALLVRIYESEAAKLAEQARWYRQTSDYIASERTIRRLLREYPSSIAAVAEARALPALMERLPQAYVRTMPNYRPIRRAILGEEGDVELPTGIPPVGTPAIPAVPQESAEPVRVESAGASSTGSGGNP
ncbi:MAG: outer membrane protein assembly factor BamD [Phycisphaeraceae bacterium]|nr:outer membrane protein assembly factor BamD [Phycisphaeraceae bacterium]